MAGATEGKREMAERQGEGEMAGVTASEQEMAGVTEREQEI